MTFDLSDVKCILFCFALVFVLSPGDAVNTTTTQATGASLNVSLTDLVVDSTTVSTTWSFEGSLKNETLNFTISCKDIKNFTEQKSYHVETLPTTKQANITNLLPGTSYACEALSDPMPTNFQNSTFTFETELRVSKLDLSITADDTSILFQWPNTERETYKVSVIEKGPNHFLPNSCQLKRTSIIENDAKKTIYEFTKAKPDFFYLVNVTGFNYNGNISSSGAEEVLTNSSASDVVRDLQVGNDTLETNQTFSYVLSWNMPCLSNGNITLFNITLDGNYTENATISHKNVSQVMVEPETEQYQLTLHSLRPSHQYRIEVVPVSGTLEGKYSYTNFTTPVLAPNPPKVTVTTSSTTIVVNWEESGNMGKILNYILEVQSLGPMYTRPVYCKPDNYSLSLTFDGTTTSYTIQNLNPDTNYNITVTAETEAGYGTTATNVTTNEQAPEKPENITVTYPDQTNTFVLTNISWQLPCLLNGEFSNTLVSISGDKSYNLGTELSLVAKLNYSTTYTVQIWLKLHSGVIGNEAALSFKTPQGCMPPGKVTNLTVVPQSRSFEIEWNPPQNSCSIITYEIQVTALKPAYNVSSDCEASMTTNYTYPVQEVDGSTTNLSFDFTKFQEFDYYNFNIAVTPKSNRGDGRTATQDALYNHTSEPNPPRKLSHFISNTKSDDYDGKATISFEPPCILNGPLVCYTLKYEASHKSKLTEENSHNITEDFTVKLKPDYEYKYNVTILTISHSITTSNQNFRAPAGVPKLDIPYGQVQLERTDTTAKLILKKEYFDETNGEVKYIAILMLNSDTLEVEKDSYEKGSDDFPIIPPHVGVEVRQILKSPFQDIIHVEIGTDSSCNSSYCNRPLEPSHEYHLVIRVYTNDFYRNSHIFKFTTDAVNNINTILGIICGILIILLLGVVVLYLWKMKYIKIPRLCVPPMIISRKSSEQQNPSLCTSYTPKKFISYYKHLENNPDLLKAQFTNLKTKSLEYSLTAPTHFAKLPENRRKNRYTNISPFDETRVKLMIDEDDEIGSDYINASYIMGYTTEVEYIATQGPLESTCRDFWKMILQENVSIIVMVSLFIEQDKMKCYRYFPRNHETILVGDDIEVKCLVELHFGIYCVRTLEIRKDNIKTLVTHMQYLQWPDFGVPSDTERMLQFCYQMRDRVNIDEGVIVVHCSAGVGRTGTLIATDILIQVANAGKNIDVFRTVEELRKQRMHMVQTEEQYFYIHKLLVEHLDRRQLKDYTATSETIENLSIIPTSCNKTKQAEIADTKL